MMLASSAFAATDGQTYEAKDGFTCENVWILDRVHTSDAFLASKLVQSSNGVSAVSDGTNVYVGICTADGLGVIEVYSLATGEYIKTISLTLNGEAYGGTLAVYNVGYDEYGHFYVAPYQANSEGTGNELVYLCDLETGALTSVGELPFDGGSGRVDFIDVIGDLTGVEAGATILGAASNNNLNVFQWTLAKGATTWEGGWDGSFFKEVSGTYPADQTVFNYGTKVKMVKPSDNGALNLFYIDGFTTLPALYDNNASLLDSFKDVDVIKTDKETGVTTGTVPEPAAGANGIAEATLGEQNFIIYPEGQYDAPHACQAVVTTVNADLEFSSMKHLWTLPADGLGQQSDGGRRYHSLERVDLPKDAAGRSAFYLLTYKCYNGMGVYKIAEEGYGSVSEIAAVNNAKISVNANVIRVSETAASIEVYNLLGQKVAQALNATEVKAPANGAYVVKAVVNGTPVVKKVIVK